MWAQRVRLRWLKVDNHNSKFFHLVANQHRRNNLISSLEVDGQCIQDHQAISQTFTDYFCSLLEAESEACIDVNWDGLYPYHGWNNKEEVAWSLWIRCSLACRCTMSLFLMPRWVIDSIDKTRRAFFWQGKRDIRGGHCLIVWTQVCRPKLHGGLGICNLREFNLALLAKWWRKLLSYHNSLWVDLINNNYYSQSRPADMQSSLPGRVSSFWKRSSYLCQSFQIGSPLKLWLRGSNSLLDRLVGRCSASWCGIPLSTWDCFKCESYC